MRAVVWATLALAGCDQGPEPTPPKPIPAPKPVPTPTPVPMDAAVVESCEATLMETARRIGDPSPRSYVHEYTTAASGSERVVELPCPATVDDEDCASVIKSRVTPNAGERVLDATLGGEFSHYEFTYELDGKLHVGRATDNADALKQLKAIQSRNPKAESRSGQRMYKRDSRVVRVRLGGARIGREQRVELRLPRPASEIPMWLEQIDKKVRAERVDLVKLQMEATHVSIHLSCAGPDSVLPPGTP